MKSASGTTIACFRCGEPYERHVAEDKFQEVLCPVCQDTPIMLHLNGECFNYNKLLPYAGRVPGHILGKWHSNEVRDYPDPQQSYTDVTDKMIADIEEFLRENPDYSWKKLHGREEQ